MAVPILDLSDSKNFAQGFPHEFFTWLRAQEPLYWHAPTAVTPDGDGFWVFSRYADVDSVIMDPAAYSSDKGGERVADSAGASSGRVGRGPQLFVLSGVPAAGKTTSTSPMPCASRWR